MVDYDERMPTARTSTTAADPELVWYAAYGSNANPERLRWYRDGIVAPAAGDPSPAPATRAARAAPPLPGGTGRAATGFRDRTPPARSVGLTLPGLLYFATESAIWTGGRAFYDPDAPAGTPVRAYLLTRAQFGDLVAQEMYRPPEADPDLTEAVRNGRCRLGPGRYETVVCPGTFEGIPILTFTAPWRWRDVPGNPPAPAYLRHIALGVRAAHGWSLREVSGYLASRPGAAGHWTPDALAAALGEPGRA
ncbi:histone deacetylase [Nocardia sp. NPDC024068]|uniref:histone deacetylase n=1 Tax=Nocardia sp. NPDC024068 TaxID=3157197 RepID=UPI0033F52389